MHHSKFKALCTASSLTWHHSVDAHASQRDGGPEHNELLYVIRAHDVLLPSHHVDQPSCCCTTRVNGRAAARVLQDHCMCVCCHACAWPCVAAQSVWIPQETAYCSLGYTAGMGEPLLYCYGCHGFCCGCRLCNTSHHQQLQAAYSHAQCSGVIPSWSGLLAEAPAFRSNVTTSFLPSCDAQ